MTGQSSNSQAKRKIAPGDVIGILGGGQLGQMLAMAAAQLGLKTHILTPEVNAPASFVSTRTFVAPYDDENALQEFAASVDAVTYEFENVPADATLYLASIGADVVPGVNALGTAQDRLVEKQFLVSIGAQTAPFEAVGSADDLARALDSIGRPAILKTRRLGYDGKGQSVLRDADTDLPDAWRRAIDHAWNELGARPSILEGFVPFEREASLIAARGANGEIRCFDPSENVHLNGILKTATVPANISVATANKMRSICSKILEALDYVGVIGVEFFVLGDGGVLVNEFAPRVHNSGHWTDDACAVSQFEQHIRAVAGWPLGDPTRHSNVVMENLVGAEVNEWRCIAGEANTCLHLYGKDDARSGRKMGHATRLTPFRGV